MVQIDGFGIPPFRSFGEGIQYIGPLQKINLVIGQNNSGKSNILRFAVDHLSEVAAAARDRNNVHDKFKGLDRHVGADYSQIKLAFGVRLGGNLQAELEAQLRQKIVALEAIEHFGKLLNSMAAMNSSDMAWFVYDQDIYGRLNLSPTLIESLTSKLHNHEWANIWNALTGQRGGRLTDWVSGVLQAISPVQFPIPPIAFVPAIRQVHTANKNDPKDFSGVGLIEKLAQFQNPGYNDQNQKTTFSKINKFLQEVTGSESAALEIPAARDTILVHLNNRTLPLEALGTGIHEVVILAAAATVMSGHVVCIEEPEIHLHPLLQRKFLEHLGKATENQYLIATHSAHLLDERDVNVFHVRLSDGKSVVERAVGPSGKFKVCVDLGYRASDLLQANCIIWVEGPSDRIYVRHWLRCVAPELIEGTHFSLMFYGGRLLSHLTANDPEVEDFISLRRLNRFISIIIDSDRVKPRQRLNATKMRVRDEFEHGPGFAWITAGREIENYIPASTLEYAIRGVHTDVVRVPDPKQFGEPLVYFRSKGPQKEADKVKVACKVAESVPVLDVLDLRKMVDRLVKFITEANGA